MFTLQNGNHVKAAKTCPATAEWYLNEGFLVYDILLYGMLYDRAR